MFELSVDFLKPNYSLGTHMFLCNARSPDDTLPPHLAACGVKQETRHNRKGSARVPDMPPEPGCQPDRRCNFRLTGAIPRLCASYPK